MEQQGRGSRWRQPAAGEAGNSMSGDISTNIVPDGAVCKALGCYCTHGGHLHGRQIKEHVGE